MNVSQTGVFEAIDGHMVKQDGETRPLLCLFIWEETGSWKVNNIKGFSGTSRILPRGIDRGRNGYMDSVNFKRTNEFRWFIWRIILVLLIDMEDRFFVGASSYVTSHCCYSYNHTGQLSAVLTLILSYSQSQHSTSSSQCY